MNIRRTVIIIHRDLGYFFVGFVLVFSISGIALNHIDHWNPNFDIERSEVSVELPDTSTDVTKAQIMGVLEPIGAD